MNDDHWTRTRKQADLTFLEWLYFGSPKRREVEEAPFGIRVFVDPVIPNGLFGLKDPITGHVTWFGGI
jgi:hypothetical protein